MALPNFYYHPRMLAYDFGPNHPLKPERLRRTIARLENSGAGPFLDPGQGDEEDARRVHSGEYLAAIRALSNGDVMSNAAEFGFSSIDNPPFLGMWEASLAYMAGSAAAARAIVEGESLAYNISGGLHHAQRSKASGFCILNDCAIAISILRERFERVSYVDIDVHHGDGVQALFWNDPKVQTCSIHQDGRTIYPGTGFAFERDAADTVVNVPLGSGTDAGEWLAAFRQGILPRVKDFAPQVLVLQLGTDSHKLDPLARIENDLRHWLAAICDLKEMGLPTLALGGGGYHLSTVPRMWTAACLALAS